MDMEEHPLPPLSPPLQDECGDLSTPSRRSMLSPIELTAASRPLLLPDETLLFVQNAVGLYEGKYKIPNYQNGCAYLTSHRACYVDNDDPRKYSVAVELKDIDRHEFYAGFIKSSPKITLYLKSSLSSGGPSASSTPYSGTPLIRPTSPLPVSTGVWICPICSFSNPVPSNYTPQITAAASIPPCLACGIRPSATLLDSTFQSAPLCPTPLSSLSASASTSTSTLYPNGGGSGFASSTTLVPPNTDNGEATFACPRCTFLNHPSLHSCEICGERLLSPNLPIDIPRLESPAPISSTRKDTLIGQSIDTIKFSFRNSGDKVFYERLRNALIQRKWLLRNAPPVPQPREAQNAIRTNGGVGIAGLERQGRNVRQKNQVVIQGAFEDLEALMGRAKEMVALAESFATRLASTPTFANADARSALMSSTQALGLVTKDMLSDKASELFLSELARQVAEFLMDDTRGVLKEEGGVITLVDLWAVFNRARGIDLISPCDLEKAARLFAKLRLPVRLRRFRSGLLVVQEARGTDEETVRRIVEWMESAVAGVWGRSVTASEAAERFGWSVGVATEELEMAEEKGILCREVSVQGVVFWRNWFGMGGG